MANERLRGCIAAAQLSIGDVAGRLSVDRKTVERWISTGRLPHRRHRELVAALLRAEESYLWPEVLDGDRVKSASEAELVALYPNRGAVPGPGTGSACGSRSAIQPPMRCAYAGRRKASAKAWPGASASA